MTNPKNQNNGHDPLTFLIIESLRKFEAFLGIPPVSLQPFVPCHASLTNWVKRRILGNKTKKAGFCVTMEGEHPKADIPSATSCSFQTCTIRPLARGQHATVEVNHVLIGHANAARRDGAADIFWLIGAVDAVLRVLAAGVQI